MGLTMKWVYILASSAVCFSAPNPQKITDKNINKVQNVAIDQTRCAVNYVNALFEKGTHTKGFKFGQLIDVLGNQAMKSPQLRKFVKGFKPAEDGQQNSLPKIKTSVYLNRNEAAFKKACFNNASCKQVVTATFRNLRAQARKQGILNRQVNGSVVGMVNNAIANSAGFPKLSMCQ